LRQYHYAMNPDQSTADSTPADVTPPVESPNLTATSVTTSSQETPLPALITLLEPSAEVPEASEPTAANEADKSVSIPTVSAVIAGPTLAPTEALALNDVEPATGELLASAPIAAPEPALLKLIPTTAVVIAGGPIVLPNGKVGEPYSFNFTPDVVDLRTCTSVRVLGPEGIGLTFNQETQGLAGQPAQAGEYELKLSYQPTDAKPDGPTHVRTLRWYVNPDPRSLWTEHEPPADLPARKEHSAHLVITDGPKTLAAASNRGRSHAKDAKFREDDFRCYYQTETNSYVLAVADGAGSASMSREGSRLACETATEHLLTQLKGELGSKVTQLANELETNFSPEARKALQDELYKLLGNAALLAARNITQVAEAAGQVVRDYATTLLLAVCQPTASGWLVGAFWIGDGGLGLYQHQEGIKLLGEPDGGEYSGQTRFLTMKDTFEGSTLYGRVRFELVRDFDALVLMTDGITDALFQTDANLAKDEKWSELLADINKVAPLQRDNAELGPQLAQWLNFWVKGEYDDRTLAILF
jgi:serine/threonine protein phosphatase PrpC